MHTPPGKTAVRLTRVGMWTYTMLNLFNVKKVIPGMVNSFTTAVSDVL
jgi:hypothetical protein